jgi:hypothetical protein
MSSTPWQFCFLFSFSIFWYCVTIKHPKRDLKLIDNKFKSLDQCWAVLTHWLKTGSGFHPCSQWEPENENRKGQENRTEGSHWRREPPNENRSSSHLTINLRTGSIFTFWERSGSHGKKYKVNIRVIWKVMPCWAWVAPLTWCFIPSWMFVRKVMKFY